MKDGKDINVIKDLKIVEWLKSQLLTTVARLFENLAKGVDSDRVELLDILSEITLLNYLLGKRLGFSYETIDKKVEENIKLSLVDEHTIEKWYGDLSQLQKHLNTIHRQE